MVDHVNLKPLGQTPWQTVGPFFHYGLPWKGGADLVGEFDMGARPELFPEEHYVLKPRTHHGPVTGQVIEVTGRVLDGDGLPIPDALIEIWQADAAGHYSCQQDLPADLVPDTNFVGFGRAATSDDGLYRFRTIRPGRVAGPGNSLQAPHIAISIFGRGLLRRLTTRLYFDDSPENAEDPILALVPTERRRTLIATRDGPLWTFDIILQGDNETVFFEF